MTLITDKEMKNLNDEPCNIKRFTSHVDINKDIEKLTEDDLIFAWLFYDIRYLPDSIYFENNQPRDNYEESVYKLGKDGYKKMWEETERQWEEERKVSEKRRDRKSERYKKRKRQERKRKRKKKIEGKKKKRKNLITIMMPMTMNIQEW